MKRVKAIVTGKVQGVWYRASTFDKAVALDLKGYVKNLPDGDVEFVAEGEDEQLDQLIAWAWQGPPMAEVQNIRIDTPDTDEEFSEFTVRY